MTSAVSAASRRFALATPDTKVDQQQEEHIGEPPADRQQQRHQNRGEGDRLIGEYPYFGDNKGYDKIERDQNVSVLSQGKTAITGSSLSGFPPATRECSPSRVMITATTKTMAIAASPLTNIRKWA